MKNKMQYGEEKFIGKGQSKDLAYYDGLIEVIWFVLSISADSKYIPR